MSEVKRYRLHMFDRYPADGSSERETHAEMRESSRGEFAKFEDIEVICSENKLLRHDVAYYLETLAKVCEMLGIDLESAKSAEGKPSDVLFNHAQKLSADFDRVTAERDALQVLLIAADERTDRLEQALKFYADGDHLLLADPDAWDTCSGEPVNFLHDDAGTASVEDGSIAKAALKPVESSGKPCACPGCDSPRCANSPFCVAHRSAKSRTRGQDPLTADGLEWLTQNDGYQQ